MRSAQNGDFLICKQATLKDQINWLLALPDASKCFQIIADFNNQSRNC